MRTITTKMHKLELMNIICMSLLLRGSTKDKSIFLYLVTGDVHYITIEWRKVKVLKFRLLLKVF